MRSHIKKFTCKIKEIFIKHHEYIGIFFVVSASFLSVYILLPSLLLGNFNLGMHMQSMSKFDYASFLGLSLLSGLTIAVSLYYKKYGPKVCSTSVYGQRLANTLGISGSVFGSMLATLACLGCSAPFLLALGTSSLPFVYFVMKYKVAIILISFVALGYMFFYYLNKVPACQTAQNE